MLLLVVMAVVLVVSVKQACESKNVLARPPSSFSILSASSPSPAMPSDASIRLERASNEERASSAHSRGKTSKARNSQCLSLLVLWTEFALALKRTETERTWPPPSFSEDLGGCPLNGRKRQRLRRSPT